MVVALLHLVKCGSVKWKCIKNQAMDVGRGKCSFERLHSQLQKLKCKMNRKQSWTKKTIIFS